MLELFFAIRDSVGEYSTVVLDDKFVVIKNLPPTYYDLYHNGRLIREQLTPNQIPGFLLDYCAELEKSKYEFKGTSICEKVSNLEVTIKKSQNMK